MQDRIEQYALELLQAIREHHPHIYAGAWVNSYTAALEAGLNPDSPSYTEAMEYLQAEGVLEWVEESRELVGKPLYTITLRGMEMLREV
jgi:2-iminoacetate synthase ThiH